MMMLFHIKIAHIVKIFPLSSKPSDFCFDSLFVWGGHSNSAIKMHVDTCMWEGGGDCACTRTQDTALVHHLS